MELILLILVTSIISTNAFSNYKNCKNYENHYLPLDFGAGVDSLTYDTSKEKIYSFNYSQCDMTPDDKFLVPDDVRIDKAKTKRIENSIEVELIEVWENYHPVTKKIIDGSGGHAHTTRSFNSDFQDAKKKFVENNCIIRVQLPKPMYRLSWNFEKQRLTTNFESMLTKIGTFVVNGEDEHAAYFSDLMVQKFGTTLVKAVTVGGVLAVEYLIPLENIKNINVTSKQKLFNVVRTKFSKKFNISYSYDASTDDIEFYDKMLTEYKTFIFGGKPKNITDDLTSEDWGKSVLDNPEIIGRETMALKNMAYHDVIYGNYPSRVIHSVWQTLRNAIKRYYDFNSYPGCTNFQAPNFILGANIDDDTCNAVITEFFHFGGVYQTCVETSDIQDFCHEFMQKNYLTGNYSCPENFTEVLFRNTTIQRMKSTNQTLKCILDEDIRRCLPFVPSVNITHSAYWCFSNITTNSTDGGTFGGIYTSRSINPLTNNKSCPGGYVVQKIDKDVFVCVGLKNQTNGVAFGGFFGCDGGNPLNVQSDVQDPFGIKFDCSKGYSINRVPVVKDCAIRYCTDSSYNKNYENEFPKLNTLVTNVSLHLEEVSKETLIVVEEERYFYYRNCTDSSWTFAVGTNEGVEEDIRRSPVLKGLYDTWLASKITSLNQSFTTTPIFVINEITPKIYAVVSKSSHCLPRTYLLFMLILSMRVISSFLF